MRSKSRTIVESTILRILFMHVLSDGESWLPDPSTSFRTAAARAAALPYDCFERLPDRQGDNHQTVRSSVTQLDSYKTHMHVPLHLHTHVCTTSADRLEAGDSTGQDGKYPQELLHTCQCAGGAGGISSGMCGRSALSAWLCSGMNGSSCRVCGARRPEAARKAQRIATACLCAPAHPSPNLHGLWLVVPREAC